MRRLQLLSVLFAALAMPAVADDDVDQIRTLGNVDLAAALADIDSELSIIGHDDCGPRSLELQLLAGDLYLAGSLDGALQQQLMPRLRVCEANVDDKVLLSRLHKLEAYAEPDMERGNAFVQQAEAEAREAGNTRVLAEALQVKAYILRQLGLLADASSALQEAIELAQAEGDLLLLARMYSDYATLKSQLQDNDTAMSYIEHALSLAQQVGAHRIVMSIRLHRSLINISRNEPESAERELRELLQQARSSGNRSMEAVILNNVASSLNRKGRPEEAVKYADQALRAALAIPSRRLTMNSHGNIGWAQMSMGRYAAAAYNYEAALTEARATKATYSEARILKELAAVYAAQKDFSQAYTLGAQAAELADQFAQRRHRVALSEVQARFDLMSAIHDKERLEQELDWQSERLRQQRFIMVLGVIAGALALFLLVLLARKYWRVHGLNQHLHRRAEELEESNNRDPLTGAGNRRHLEAQLELWRDSAPAGTDRNTLAVMVLDLDHFKMLNDSEGHTMGDAALVEFARRVQRVLRDGDVFVRWGGDEFCILARARTTDEVQRLAQRVVNEIRAQPFVLGDAWRTLTASAGVVSVPVTALGEANWMHVLESADIALYLAKRMGRNRSICLEFTAPPDGETMSAVRNDPVMASARGLVQLFDGLSRTG